MAQVDDPSHLTDDKSSSQDTALPSVKQYGAGERRYPGSGTLNDPYVVDWDQDDPENPFNWSKHRKWLITIQTASTTFTVSFCSSSYTGGLATIMKELHMSSEVGILGVSLYVLGFGLGPLVFAPLGEVFGRRIVFLVTCALFTLLHLGGALGHNAATLLSTRMLAGIFGSAPLTNAGGTLSDMWVARERGVATALYAIAPFMGPVLGPIVSGWIVETRLGWRFNFWLMFILSALSWTAAFLVASETFAPALLRWRARKLEKEFGGQAFFVSKHDLNRSTSFVQVLKLNLKRPFVFLIYEPIVLLLSLYVAIIYATLYAFFAAFPIVFQETRHFSPGQGGLAFLGVGLGTLIGIALAPLNNKLYINAMKRNGGNKAPPEARLYMPMFGAIVLPAGLFWFAWTCNPPVFWLVPILAGVPFGAGLAQIMQGLIQYLMDTYTIYCASAIAATVILRSVLAAVFPLICPFMFANIGNHWAIMVFALLAATCAPLPFLFYKYGAWIRGHSRFASGRVSAVSLGTVAVKPIAADVGQLTPAGGLEKASV